MDKRLEHFPNLVTMFLTRARVKGEAPFLWDKVDGQWQSISWSETATITSVWRQGVAPARGR